MSSPVEPKESEPKESEPKESEPKESESKESEQRSTGDLDPSAVPQWHELPQYAQQDLAASGHGADWFAAHAQDPVLRLTVLNLYVKLKGLNLWRFVGVETDSQRGCLHFLCPAVEELRMLLRESSDFTHPSASSEGWDSRERRADGALHFKHFKGWPADKLQAHIDPHGARLHSDLWFLIPVIPLTQLLIHAADPTGYTEVFRIRALLLKQGWDSAPLIGKPVTP